MFRCGAQGPWLLSGFLWASRGGLDGEVDFPCLPGRVDAAVHVPPASDSPRTAVASPAARHVKQRPAPFPCHPSAWQRRASGRGWAGGHLPPPFPLPSPPHIPYPCLPAKLSNPGLGLLGQFPLHQLNPRLLFSQKLSLPTRSRKLLQRGCAIWGWLPGGSRAAVAAPYAAQPCASAGSHLAEPR